MANGFLSLLPFRPSPTMCTKPRKPPTILPAEDILDFEYPPQSSFCRQEDVEIEDNFIRD